MAHKSVIWRLFGENTLDKTRATCTLCNESVARGGNSIASFSTSNLWQHLQRCNKDAYEQLKVEDAQSKATKSTKQNASSMKRQPTIAASFDNRRPFAHDDARSKEITKFIGEMLALDDLPFNFVNNVGFRRLLNHLEPRYNVPNDKYFRTRLLPDMYAAVRTEVQREVEKAESVAFTTDTWSTSQCTDSLISLTAHWIDDDWSQKSALLHAQHIEGMKSAKCKRTF